MTDTCTITWTAIDLLGCDWSIIVPAATGVAAVLFSVAAANRHQREEAAKQRLMVAAGVIVHSVYNMVRASHRNADTFHDHGSNFEIGVRQFSIDAIKKDPRFVKELMVWVHLIRQDCRALGVRPRWSDHNSQDIADARAVAHLFVNYLTDWLSSGPSARRAWVVEMGTQRAILWPDWHADHRVWP